MLRKVYHNDLAAFIASKTRGIAGLALALLFLWGLPSTVNAQDRLTVSVDNLLDNSDQYIGRTVTITGETGKFHGDNVLMLSDAELLDERIFVVSDSPINTVLNRTISEGSDIQLTGTVRRMTIAEIEQQYGLDFDQDLEDEMANRPVLVISPVASTTAVAVEEPVESFETTRPPVQRTRLAKD